VKRGYGIDLVEGSTYTYHYDDAHTCANLCHRFPAHLGNRSELLTIDRPCFPSRASRGTGSHDEPMNNFSICTHIHNLLEHKYLNGSVLPGPSLISVLSIPYQLHKLPVRNVEVLTASF
jgi:hypothetical protein